MKANLWKNSVVLLALAALLYQCEDPHERYEDPPWLGGTNIETLESEGNYTHFLALMDKAEYRVSIENQLFTLFVPNDSAFEAYFQSRGISSVEDMSKQEAEELFGQHILINPRSRDQLMYEYAWFELQDPQGEYGTLFHRKVTYSIPLDYSEEVRYEDLHQGQTLKIHRENTMIPLWTTEYFEDYFGDPNGSDYLFMYPESNWSGTQWHDAMITEAEVRTSSGFIYYLDRVVAPIPTIDKYLHDHQDEFGLFFDLAQRLATYSDAGVNEQLERLYKKSYTEISDIAEEWGPSGAHDGGDMYPEMVYMFTAFIPYDDVLQEFLDNTVLQQYESVDEAPELFLVYLLQSHLNTFLNLPSKMEQRFLNYFGDQIDINLDNDIGPPVMCSNGVIYPMNRYLEPNAFSCVPGPLFYNNEYSAILYALRLSGMLNTVSQPDIGVTLLAPSDDLLEEYGIRLNQTPSSVFLEKRGKQDDTWRTMETDDIQKFVEDYFHFGEYEDFSGEGYMRMASDNYVYYNAGQLAGGGNQVEGDYCTVLEKLVSEKNGNLFYLDNAIKEPDNAAELILSDPDLSSFAELLDQAALIDSVQDDYELTGVLYPKIIFMAEMKQWTLLAPTNQAIADAELAGIIPEDQNELRNFIYYHFVRGRSVFDDGEFSGSAFTNRIDTVIGSDVYYETLDFSNSLYSLSLQDGSGQIVNIDHEDANNLIETGVLHKINSVLQLEP